MPCSCARTVVMKQSEVWMGAREQSIMNCLICVMNHTWVSPELQISMLTACISPWLLDHSVPLITHIHMMWWKRWASAEKEVASSCHSVKSTFWKPSRWRFWLLVWVFRCGVCWFFLIHFFNTHIISLNFVILFFPECFFFLLPSHALAMLPCRPFPTDFVNNIPWFFKSIFHFL